MFNPGLVYDAGLFEYLGFLCDAAPQIFVDAAATCGGLADAGIPIVATNLNYPSIAVSELPGAKTILRTVTNVSGVTGDIPCTRRRAVWLQVTVAPDRFTLDPGESATFEVVLVNLAAPIGEWRFGSLSWVDGDERRVRSPIAVKAAAIEFAEEVGGTGAAGTASIPVAFGYTGVYTAGAHGLSPDVLVPGVVAMDPDQEFDPADPTGTTAHDIEVTDAAFLKIALDTADLTPTNPAIDIDLYLYNSAGEEVAIRRLEEQPRRSSWRRRPTTPTPSMSMAGRRRGSPCHTTSIPGSCHRQRVEDHWPSPRRRRQRRKAQ